MRQIARVIGSYDAAEVSRDTGLGLFDAGYTVQSAKDEVDINTIVRNFGITGQLPQNVRVPQYGDFTDVSDFSSAMEAVRSAQESFGKMDADTRERFGNDPQRFLEFCADEGNLEEMRKLGLAVPLEIVEPPKE